MGKHRHGNEIVNSWKTKRHNTLSNLENCSRNGKKCSTFEKIMITIPIYNKGVTMITLSEAL